MADVGRVVLAPPPDAAADILVDCLELIAFFDPKRVARLDAIQNELAIASSPADEDIGDADAEIDAFRQMIEVEILARSEALGDAYPFVLSNDGEELLLKPKGERRGACFYLVCLIVSHFSGSPLLKELPNIKEQALLRRRHFQTLATLAIAGQLKGPAVSFGAPREDQSPVLEALKRFIDKVGVGKARETPGPEASPSAKDGGMDVLGWIWAVDRRPPPTSIWFGQAASGHKWPDKSALDEVDQFLEGYFENRPACNYNGITVVPFRLSETDHAFKARRHGCILDRLRTPRAALEGYEYGVANPEEVDEVNNAWKLNRWLTKYRHAAMAA